MISSKIINTLRNLFLSLILLSGGQQVWAEDGLEGSINVDTPAVSPDGKKMIFSSDSSGNTTIWIADRDGKNARSLVNWTSSHQIDPDWSADGQSILFSSDRESNNYDIWSIRIDGTNPVKLTSNFGDNREARYSPSGDKIVFTSNRTGKDELWSMSSDGSNQKAIAYQLLLINDPTWSPDGTKVAYSGCTRPANGEALSDGICNLYSVKIDTGEIKQLTSGKFQDWSHDWSSLGIVFSSSRGIGQSLWTIDETGGNLRQITKGSNGLELDPRWDKLTGTIVFSKVGSTPNIWSTDVSGKQEQLTSLSNKKYTLQVFVRSQTDKKDDCSDKKDKDNDDKGDKGDECSNHDDKHDKDNHDDKGLKNAKVVLDSTQTAITNGGGHAKFKSVKAGSHTLAATLAGYTCQVVPVTLDKKPVVSVTIPCSQN